MVCTAGQTRRSCWVEATGHKPQYGIPPLGQLCNRPALGARWELLLHPDALHQPQRRVLRNGGVHRSAAAVLRRHPESRERHRGVLLAGLQRQRNCGVEQQTHGCRAQRHLRLRHGIAMEHHVAGRIPLDAAQGNVYGHYKQLVHPAGMPDIWNTTDRFGATQQLLRRAVRREGALRRRPLVRHGNLQARPGRDGAIGRHQRLARHRRLHR